MSKSNFSEDFKRDAVRQITERGYPVAEVSQRLGVSQHSLYEWKKKLAASNAKGNDEAEEIRRLKKELARVTEERDILKKSGRVFRQRCKVKYAFWLKNPLNRRANEDKRQTDLLLKAWEESGKVYGYRKLHDDLLDQGEMCCPNRVARLTRLAGIKAQIGYKRRPGIYGGRPAAAVGNTLDRQFDAAAPDKAWVTASLTSEPARASLTLRSSSISIRRAIGWAMQSRQTTDVVLQALLMAAWRRKPKDKALIHSDQGSQFTRMDWASFLRHHTLVH